MGGGRASVAGALGQGSERAPGDRWAWRPRRPSLLAAAGGAGLLLIRLLVAFDVCLVEMGFKESQSSCDCSVDIAREVLGDEDLVACGRPAALGCSRDGPQESRRRLLIRIASVEAN